MKYGYARVSTDGQKIAPQVAALKAGGAGKVFREVASGAKTDRAQLRKAIATLGAGDVLMVTRLDRLARSRKAFASPWQFRATGKAFNLLA
jgi:DNA invertase Pin-like site-specific DNA recombinase